jgi:hypothetical protein
MWMFGAAASYAKSVSNYSVINANNLFNFLINVMESLTDDQKTKFIENMKVNMGMTVTEQFKQYIFKKLPNSPLLKFF